MNEADALHLLPPEDWPLAQAREELARLRELRDALEAAGVPAYSLESCDAEIRRSWRAVHCVEVGA